MSYASQANLSERFGDQELIRLTDRTNMPPTTIAADVVQQALDSADGVINGYLQGAGITTPMSSPPLSIIDAACAIARYKLWKDKASDRVRQDYEDTVAWLVNVSKGIVSLGDNAAPATPASAGSPQISAPPRTFDRFSLRDL